MLTVHAPLKRRAMKAIRYAVFIGGDTDTVACITSGLADVMFGLPDEIREKARSYLTDDMKDVVDRFVD